jgi:hypothetical protein
MPDRNSPCCVVKLASAPVLNERSGCATAHGNIPEWLTPAASGARVRGSRCAGGHRGRVLGQQIATDQPCYNNNSNSGGPAEGCDHSVSDSMERTSVPAKIAAPRAGRNRQELLPGPSHCRMSARRACGGFVGAWSAYLPAGELRIASKALRPSPNGAPIIWRDWHRCYWPGVGLSGFAQMDTCAEMRTPGRERLELRQLYQQVQGPLLEWCCFRVPNG